MEMPSAGPGLARSVAAALSLLALTISARAGADPTCPPAAEITGAPELASSLDSILSLRGVAGASAGCPAVRAILRRSGAGLDLIVIHPGGRTSQRTVASVGVAASAIEA